MKWGFGVLVTLGAALGCGDNAQGMQGPDADAAIEIDAFVPSGPCWDTTDSFPQGAATLGTGWDAFEAMPTNLPIEHGTQNGFNLVANVQMRGLAPGDPANIFNPSNPRTRVLAFFADNGMPLNRYAKCPFRVGYKQIGADTYELADGVGVIFETCWRAEHLIGRQVRIELEVMDSARGFTTDTRVVTLAAPTSGYPSGEGLPGCPPL